jgi:hypothetical protein
MGFLTRFGLGLARMWEHKVATLTTVVTVNVVSWLYFWLRPSILGFMFIVLAASVLVAILLIGTVPVLAMVENKFDEDVVRRMSLGTLVSLVLSYALLTYVGSFMLGFIDPPPYLLIVMALFFALPITPYVVLAILLPPLIGYFMRSRWYSLRHRVPFWGAYLGFLASAMFLVMPLIYFRVIMVSISLINSFILAGVTMIASAASVINPRPSICKIIGLAMVFIGILSWLIAIGGLTWGSVLAIISGSYLYDWKPKPPT